MTTSPKTGIYIHWPFCASKCPYCDFNSHINDSINHQDWRDAYTQEIQWYKNITGDRHISSIFFGGGTPSLMEPETVETVISTIQKTWHLSNDAEITLEANPTSIETEKFKAFRSAGINRVSIGVQSLNDDELKFLGRTHSAAEAVKAINIAASTFDRYSFDLIYARPQQTTKEWENELCQALEHANGHLSLYQLTIEQGTPFYGRHKRGEFTIPDQDHGGELYELTQTIMSEAGYPAYETSNHAVPGQESRHNLIYWNYDDYIGIGPGAHGRLTFNKQKHATRTHRAPDIWMKHVKEKQNGAHPFEPLNDEQQFEEALMMGLRLTDGINLSNYKNWQSYINTDRLKLLTDDNFLILKNDTLRTTVKGAQRLNAILGYLL